MRVLSNRIELWVAGEVEEVVEAQVEGMFKFPDGTFELAGQHEAACQIITSPRVGRHELAKPLVHLKCLSGTALCEVVVSQDLPRFDEVRVALHKPFQEPDFDLERSRALALAGSTTLIFSY